MAITITSDGQVEIDGQLAGRVADTIANNPKLASDIQRAYDDWHPAITKEAADCRANAATLQAQVDSLTKQLTEAKQAATECNTKLSAAQKLIDAMGGTEVGQQIAKDARISAAKEAMASAAAALTAEGIDPQAVADSAAVSAAPEPVEKV